MREIMYGESQFHKSVRKPNKAKKKSVYSVGKFGAQT